MYHSHTSTIHEYELWLLIKYRLQSFSRQDRLTCYPIIYLQQQIIPGIWDFIYSRIIVILYWITNPVKLFQTILYSVLDMNYLVLFTFFAANFYLFTLFFCLLIYLVGLYKEECVKVGAGTLADMKSSGQIFSALFALSWTTISTVGYGNTWPALSKLDDEGNAIRCPAMNMLLMIEAFVGVCFAGGCGAILFGKVVQVQSQAQVEFSQPMVLRFGTGVMSNDDADDSDDEGLVKKSGALPTSGISCPILEFRVVNKLYKIPNGVITDASVNCVASMHEIIEEMDYDGNKASAVPSFGTLTSTVRVRGEDNITRIRLPKKIFLDLNIVNNEHPHFKRCWTALHILNENSPLLSPKMRSRIRKNHGLWPNDKDKYNTAQYIRDNMNFEEIIVSFNGVSMHTSCGVNAQKVYSKCDTAIGYQFVPVLEKEGDDVKVQIDHLNDVTDQAGSDAPLDMRKRWLANR
jgi:hypothetical protein